MTISLKVASWGLGKESKKAFRPAMSLHTGELSAISGCFLMMTATSTPKTRRIIQAQLPEISKWVNLLSVPLRPNVTVLVPPPDSISSKVEVTLAPFIDDMKLNETTYLILVRGRKSELIFWSIY